MMPTVTALLWRDSDESHVFSRLCRRYGVTVINSDDGDAPDEVYLGPDMCSGYIWPWTVWVSGVAGDTLHHAQTLASAVHELAHLVLARCRMDIELDDEGDGLIQLEEAWLQSCFRDRPAWVSAVEHYRSMTVVVDGHGNDVEVGSHRHVYMKTEWWRNGLLALKDAGILTPSDRPTFRSLNPHLTSHLKD